MIAHGFLKVPDHEVLALINSEELAQTCCKLYIVELEELCFGFFISCASWSVILEIQVAPFDLSNRVFASMIPDSERCSKLRVI